MKINKVLPFYFRAFCDNIPVVFSDNLTIFYGCNGAGKSSLSEAVEWLLYGYTKRRKKGDEYSKNEYKGSYVHNACPKGVAPYVEAEIMLDDDSTHLIRRTIKLNKGGFPLDQETILSVDGNPVDDFKTIGLEYTEAHCPVIVQHGIQDFVHTRPIDRYRIISEALGLSDLVEFKDVLDKAKTSRRNNPPTDVAEAKTIVVQLISKLKMLDMAALATQWEVENYSIDSDYSLILDKGRELSESKATTNDAVLRDIRSRQAEEINKVFDIIPFRPNQNLATIMEYLLTLKSQIEESDNRFRATTVAYAGASASRYQVAQLEFWKSGLDLVNIINPAECPFCEEPTLTPTKIQNLKARIDVDQHLSDSFSSFVKETDHYIDLLSQVEIKLSQLEFSSVSNENLEKLRKLFEKDKDRLKVFVEENRQCVNLVHNLRDVISLIKNSLTALKISITQPDKVTEAVSSVTDIPARINKELTEALESLKKYNETFVAFRPIFERELSDEETVKQYTNLIDLLNNFKYLRLVAKVKTFDNEILECQRIVEEYILSQQKIALASREAEILNWYSLLSPNTDVKFSGLEPGRNEYSLKAEAFGKTMSAAASLSQSQLNCLGLSIYIPSVSAPDSPFKFILFDDPVQAMDDDHHESFLLRVVPELLAKHHFQVIILTHLKETADRLRDINFASSFVYYRFDKLKASGPVITEHIVLGDDMKKNSQLGSRQ